jgi:uncharacterized protein YbjT (DUF2867 family)
MKIVVIGGTGLIGSKLVTLLRDKGHEAVVAVPDTGVDTLTGEGLAEALAGAQVVVDVSNSPSFEAEPAMAFFRTATGNILAAEAAAGVGHHVALSVVGTDRMQGSGYFRAKQAQEDLISASDVPHTIVHATQFFEFVKVLIDSATDGDTVLLSSVPFRPMAADDVAAAVCDVALGAPASGIVEIGGPEVFPLDELARHVLSVRDDPRHVETEPRTIYYGTEVDEQALLPGPDARLAGTRFDDWLSRVPA